MTLRHLRVFVTVAETGKMRSAARELFIAQSAVSQTILELERYYDVKLFDRLANRLYITPAGRELLDYAKHILTLYDEMELHMHSSAEKSEIRVGTTFMVGTCIIATLLEEYRKRWPQVVVKVYIGNVNTLGERLRASQLDFLLMEGTIPDNNFIAEEVLDDPMVVVCSPEHPFASRKSVTLEEISKMPYIGREKSNRVEFFDEIMTQHNLPLNFHWISNNSETTKMAVMRNFGITAISRRIVAAEINAGLMHEVQIEDQLLMRKVRLVYHKNKFITAPMQDIFALCRRLEEILP